MTTGTVAPYRGETVLKWSVLGLSACLLLAAGSVRAADQAITGKKLLLKSTPKFVLLSKDASIHLSGSPVCPAADSSLTFDDGFHTHTFALPCANWSDNGTVAKYKNSSAPGGPSEVKVSKDKAGLLKVVGKGLGGFPVPNGAATIGVVFNFGGAIDRYCMSFSGTGDGNKFLVKDAPTGTCPGPTQTCGNNVREGTEQCDGTDDAACPDLCQPDCTCGQNPPCGTTYPACQGDCPAGQSCGVSGTSCVCGPANPTACDSTAPACNGTCASGQTCAADDPFLAPTCGCIPNMSLPCSNSESPTCGGACPSGQSCVDSGLSYGCVCF